MRRIKTYVSKKFLFDFESEYIRYRVNIDPDDRTFERFDLTYRVLSDSEMKIAIEESELKEVILGETNPVVKMLLKKRSDAHIDPNIFEGINVRNGQDYFDDGSERYPIKLYCVDGILTEKNIKQYMGYYGYAFLDISQIKRLKVREEYQIGINKLDKQAIYNSFNPYHSLIIIDPYLFDKYENQQQLYELIANILPAKAKTSVYIDLVTKRTDDNKFKKKFEESIEGLKTATGVDLILKTHEISAVHLHDRNYIGNNFIVNFGHGLEALKDKKESDIRVETLFSRTDNKDFMQKLIEKLTYYKDILNTDLGENPIWKVVN
ncbi:MULTISPECIES: hypothetical protein [unclassified Sphingobacterium]|uniref:hypothetical protein n=1 Tax=unclassified Sphingobacterium TaxID=2609468 RepID=UPI0025F66BDD|nr:MULTISPECIES: hypothetical protein [unclassified Sphingobacterium]